MGLKHRDKRKAVKASLRRWGWKENEYGELTHKLSKAEARQHLLRMRQTKWEIALPKVDLEAAQVEVMYRANQLARESVMASFDAEVLGLLGP